VEARKVSEQRSEQTRSQDGPRDALFPCHTAFWKAWGVDLTHLPGDPPEESRPLLLLKRAYDFLVATTASLLWWPELLCLPRLSQ
jgi:hypothetical protein